MRFWLGVHKPAWLERTSVPLMVSHRILHERRTLPRTRGPWVLDSGGFTELSMYGGWWTTPADYVAAARRYADEIGQLAWAAPQDWMCELVIILGLLGKRRTSPAVLRRGGYPPCVGAASFAVSSEAASVIESLRLPSFAPGARSLWKRAEVGAPDASQRSDHALKTPSGIDEGGHVARNRWLAARSLG